MKKTLIKQTKNLIKKNNYFYSKYLYNTVIKNTNQDKQKRKRKENYCVARFNFC